MKHILVIENENLDPQHMRFLESLQKNHYRDDCETYIVDRLRFDKKKKEELLKIIKTKPITDIFFYSTFIYQDSTAELYDILSKLPQTLTVWSIYSSCCREILEAIDIETREQYDRYMSMKRHVFNTYLSYYVDDNTSIEFEQEDWIVEDRRLDRALDRIEIKEAEEEDKKNKEELLKLELQEIYKRPTNTYVRVGKLRAYGSEFTTLKEGDIVPILRNPSTDENKHWGVWVRGKTEPVRLLNDQFYLEFEMLGVKQDDGSFKLGVRDLAREILSANGRGKSDVEYQMLCLIINRFLYLDKYDNNLYNWFTSEILDKNEIPRRLYRSYFFKKIEEYKGAYRWFMEIDKHEENRILQTW